MARSHRIRRRRALLIGSGAVAVAGASFWWWRGRRKIEDLLNDLATLVSFEAPLPPERTASHARTLKEGLAEIFEPDGTIEIEGWAGASLRTDAIVGDLLLLRSELDSMTIVVERVIADGQARVQNPSIPKGAQAATARARATIRKLDGSTDVHRADLDVVARGRPLKLMSLRGREADGREADGREADD